LQPGVALDHFYRWMDGVRVLELSRLGQWRVAHPAPAKVRRKGGR
jgi:hypothetical protein